MLLSGAGVFMKRRAATWGRPYDDSGALLSVGADLCVRPPVLGAHIGAPLQKGSPQEEGWGRAGPLNSQFSIPNS